MDFEKVKSLIVSLIASSKNGVLVSNLADDYASFIGGTIPYSKFGFSTLKQFMSSLSDVVEIQTNSAGAKYVAKLNERSSQVQRLVSMQKSGKSKVKKKCKYLIKNENFSLKSTNRLIINRINELPEKSVIIKEHTRLQNDRDKLIGQKVKPHDVLNISKTFDVSITHFSTCDKLYVCLLSEKEHLKEITGETSSCEQLGIQVKAGMFVISPKKLRAKVFSITDKFASVYNIDVGTYDNVLVSDLSPFPQKYSFHCQAAILCSLYRLDGSFNWSPLASHYFKQLGKVNNLQMKVVGVFCDPESNDSVFKHSVILYKNEKSINQILFDYEIKRCLFSTKIKEIRNLLPNLQISHSQRQTVVVLNVHDVTEIEACLSGSANLDKLDQLEEEMRNYYNSNFTNLSEEFSPGSIYALVSFTRCVRVYLVSITTNEEVKVRLVDRGGYKTVKLDDLRILDPAFLQLPSQIISLQLSGFNNPELTFRCGSLYNLKKQIVNKTFEAEFISSLGCHEEQASYIVCLRDASGNDVTSVVNEAIRELEEQCSMKEGDVVEGIIVSYICRKSSRVYLQMASVLQSLTNLLKVHLEQINSSNDIVDEIVRDVRVGQFCLALINDQLHRVRIEDSSDDRNILVNFIDIGYQQHVKRISLYKLESPKLFSFPNIALCCQLSDPNSISFDKLDCIKSHLRCRVDKKLNFSYKIQLFMKDHVDCKFISAFKNDALPVCILKFVSPCQMVLVTANQMVLRDRLELCMQISYTGSFKALQIDQLEINKTYALKTSINLWCRATVLSIVSCKIRVYLVDYGDVIEVNSISNFRHLSNELSSWKSFVWFAELAGSSISGDGCHNNLGLRLNDLNLGENYSCTIISIASHPQIKNQSIYKVTLTSLDDKSSASCFK